MWKRLLRLRIKSVVWHKICKKTPCFSLQMGDQRQTYSSILRARPTSYGLPAGCSIHRVRTEVQIFLFHGTLLDDRGKKIVSCTVYILLGHLLCIQEDLVDAGTSWFCSQSHSGLFWEDRGQRIHAKLFFGGPCWYEMDLLWKIFLKKCYFFCNL